MSSTRRSTRVPKPAQREQSVHVYEKEKKHSREELAVEKKKEARSQRPGRGLRRKDTVFEYDGHPETRETADNPFGRLMGARIEVYDGKGRDWKKGKVVEFHAFDGLHVVEHDDGTRLMYNFARKKYRLEGAGTTAVPPTGAASASASASAPAADGTTKAKRAKRTAAGSTATEEEDDNATLPAPAPGAHALGAGSAAARASAAGGSGILSASGAAVVDPESGLGDQGHVYQDGDTVYEARLTEIDLSKNMDKYYKLQVIEGNDKSSYWCMQHWGRTGTKGQVHNVGPSSKDEAIRTFEAKFHDKAGIAFADRDTAPTPAGHYKYTKRTYTAGGDECRVMWQYYVDDYVDGKGCGWYNYDDTAAATVDGVWSEWNTTKNDEFLSVRCVHSGHFDYALDFKTMTQTNTSTSRCRKIRRVALPAA